MAVPTPADLPPDLGTPLAEIETPALLIDLDVFSRNVDRYVDIADRSGVNLRSHVKTHKIPELAHYQHEQSAEGGIVCQTLGEAEVMAAAGLPDIYLSYQVVGKRKLNRLLHLGSRVSDFATTVDHRENIQPLQRMAKNQGSSAHVILELDIGLARTGVPPGPEAIALAEMIDEAPNLVFDGVMAYEAHVKSQATTEDEYEHRCWEAMESVASAVDQIEDAGVAVSAVKVGGTATSPYSARHPIVTEINPGQYAFNDVGELSARPWAVDAGDCAVTVLTSVISRRGSERAIVDAGSKTISMDTSYSPRAKGRDGVTYEGYSEEHGHLKTDDRAEPLEIGDRLEFIPPHVCPTINLHDSLIGIRNGHVENVWCVQARGKVR